jgi:hypothetical protein
MITIERMGRPFNVTEQVAAAIEKADLVKEKQRLEEQNEQLREELEMATMATSEAHDGGAEWSFDSSDGTPVSLAGHTYRLDSDRFDSLYDSGLIGCLQTENGQYWADSVTLDSLHDSGLVVLDESGIYMDAKCAGRGWMPGGAGGKCKRVPKGTAKKVASETAGINRLAAGGNKNEARSARIAKLQRKLSTYKKNAEEGSMAERLKAGKTPKYRALDQRAGELAQLSNRGPRSIGGEKPVASPRKRQIQEKEASLQKKASQAARLAMKERLSKGKTTRYRKLETAASRVPLNSSLDRGTQKAIARNERKNKK